MALTEQRILRAVTVRADIPALEVEWRDEILRDGEVISSTPHRKAYGPEQRAEFEAEVEGASGYLTAAGWA